jgi:hypothetical protein
MEGGGDTPEAALRIGEMLELDNVEDSGPLRREICRALTYQLQLALGNEDPGCKLNVDGNALLPAVRDVPDAVVQLWRAIAAHQPAPATGWRSHRRPPGGRRGIPAQRQAVVQKGVEVVAATALPHTASM